MSNDSIFGRITASKSKRRENRNQLVYRSCGDATADSDVVFACAFALPAVCQTLGRERWGEIRSTFFALARNEQWKVRRTLSYSLHELARILGPEIAEEDLLDT